jgi:CheY-like chemotaxis protein
MEEKDFSKFPSARAQGEGNPDGSFPHHPEEPKEEYYIWYTYGVEEGPYDFEKIKNLISEGRLREEDKIWLNRLGEWKSANEISELKKLFEGRKSGSLQINNLGKIKKKLLLIEDDDSLREILADVLQEKGYLVVNAGDGLEGLRKVYVELPDLVILDIVLPQLNGLEVCKRLKKDEKMKNMPVIFLTAKDQVTDKLLGIESGGEIYLTKPFDMEELVTKVKTLLK